ncbi:uncharacterized protein LOC114535146 [Dendronephthya gigantea]|uniref:uncharacterized protein LOC114535146 n=1 Tax=Dendronephthya gigantea TaxID=151771 RepID=UPI00106DC58C|nr:uncharacterized protein LOC114535146 [Dendronephthya gigantea]
MVCWKLPVPAFLILVNILCQKVIATQADVRESHGSSQGIPSSETNSRVIKLRKKAKVSNDLTKSTNWCKFSISTASCKKSKFERGKQLILRRERTSETNGATRTLIIVNGDQEISREYIKQHHDFKPVLKALKQRIETLQARKQGKILSTTGVNNTSLRHLKIFPYLVRSASRDTEGGKKENVLSTAYTEVTDPRSSSPDYVPYWQVLGTIHTYDIPKKIVSRPLHREKLPDPYNDVTLSKLPLYDDRVLKDVTSGLKIFVKDSNEKKNDKDLSHQTLTGVTPAPSSSTNGLHDISSGEPTSSGLHDDTLPTSSGLHDNTLPSSSGLHDDTLPTSSGFHDVSSDVFASHTSNEPSSRPTSSHVTTESVSAENNVAMVEKSPHDEDSISVDDLFNDDDSKATAKIDRLLSDDKATDALAKEIASLLTDEPVGSSENPKASPKDLAIITDDAPIKQKAFQPVTDVTPVSSEEAVSSAQKSTPLSVSTATQQCLAKRGLGSTQCSLSMICCSACCPLDSCPLKDIFKKDEIPDDCDCKRHVVCPGLPNPSPVVSFHSPRPHFVTFAERPTSLAWTPGVLPPATPNLLPGLVPPTHPAVFVGPYQQQTPTLIRHPGLPYQIAQPALSPLNINYHWPPHFIPHNPGFPPLFGPPVYHRPLTYTHPIHPYIHHHPAFMRPPILHPPIFHPPILHAHPPIFHPVPIHFHPPHVPVIIHPPPQPVVIHAPPPPPPPPPPTTASSTTSSPTKTKAKRTSRAKLFRVRCHRSTRKLSRSAPWPPSIGSSWYLQEKIKIDSNERP